MHSLLVVLAIAAIARLWLVSLPASFWVDEAVTVFVVHHGANDPSLAVAPQVPQSIYYSVARAADALFGPNEIAYRLPSILLTALTLFLVAMLARRLVHPEAAWFAVFACLTLRGLNVEAADARPYALGFCMVAAAFLFLVRWLDSAVFDDRRCWLEAAAFVVCASLIWRVHLIFWPIYPVMFLYAMLRVSRGETKAGYARILALFALVALSLVPVAATAFAIYRNAHAHVIMPPPTPRQFLDATKWRLILFTAAGAWIFGRFSRWTRESSPVNWSAAALINGWWLAPPVTLFVFSWITGNSVFVPRYYSIALPGAALAAAFFVARLLPKPHWTQATFLIAAAALFVVPRNLQSSDWRGAANAIATLSLPSDTPVICPSPFIEAKSPVWSPDYSLPGFLYAHLPVYPVPGKEFLFPFESSPEAEEFAAHLSRDVFPPAGRFLVYGGDKNVRFWRDWFAVQPELAGWTWRSLGKFGDVDAVLFESREIASAHRP